MDQPKNVYGRRVTIAGHRVQNNDGIVHLVAETGDMVVCGMRIAARPWEKQAFMINGGGFLGNDTVVTCVSCLGGALPWRRLS